MDHWAAYTEVIERLCEEDDIAPFFPCASSMVVAAVPRFWACKQEEFVSVLVAVIARAIQVGYMMGEREGLLRPWQEKKEI